MPFAGFAIASIAPLIGRCNTAIATSALLALLISAAFRHQLNLACLMLEEVGEEAVALYRIRLDRESEANHDLNRLCWTSPE